MTAAIVRAQIEHCAAWVAAEIGDDDPAAQEAFDEAFAVLTETHPASIEEAAARLRFLAYVGNVCAGCESTGAKVRAGMLMVAAWLALAATAEKSNVAAVSDLC